MVNKVYIIYECTYGPLEHKALGPWAQEYQKALPLVIGHLCTNFDHYSFCSFRATGVQKERLTKKKEKTKEKKESEKNQQDKDNIYAG